MIDIIEKLPNVKAQDPSVSATVGHSEEGRTNAVFVVHVVAVVVDGPIAVDVCSIVLVVAGRPKPPP